MSIFHDSCDVPMDLSVKTRRKLRLEEFLRQNLDHAPADRVIQWVNREEGVFRILWTHQSSGAFTREDAALFRYWALARGKPANLSSVELKQSLRMALNKSPSVERVNATNDEYRYFRFTDWGRRRSDQRNSRHRHLDPESTESGYSAFHTPSSPAMYPPLKSEAEGPAENLRYVPYSLKDEYLILKDSLSNGSASDSYSISSNYSESSSITNDDFQPSDDAYVSQGSYSSLARHYQKHQKHNYHEFSPDSYGESRDLSPMDLAFGVPSGVSLLPKEEMESYHSFYDDSLCTSIGPNRSFRPPTSFLALNNNPNYGLLCDSLTIDRRKHNLMP